MSHKLKDQDGKSVQAVEAGRKGGLAATAIKGENGKSIHAVELGRKGGLASAAKRWGARRSIVDSDAPVSVSDECAEITNDRDDSGVKLTVLRTLQR